MILKTRGLASASAIAAVALCLGAASSYASISGSMWENYTGDTSDLTAAQITALGTPTATFTSSQVNFGAPTDLMSDFISYGGTTTTFLTGASHSGDNINNTFWQFTGQIYLTAGVNTFSAGHDDGLNINIQGLGTVLDVPGPTAFTLTPFTVSNPGAAGLFNFTLDYNECCSPPAYLEWAFQGSPVTGGVPDSGMTLSLLGMGLAGLAGISRRFKK